MSRSVYYVTCSREHEGGCEGDVQEWFIDGYDPVPAFVMCEKHAADFGFCTHCGGFIGGTEDIFLTGKKGLCFDCSIKENAEMERALNADMGYDDEDLYYDD